MGAWLLNVQALKDADLSLVKPLVNLNVIVVIIITYLATRERLTPLEGGGVIITLIGAVILGMQPVSKPEDFDTNLLIFFALLTGLFYSGFVVLSIPIEKKHVSLAIATGLMYGLIAALTNAVVMIEQPSITEPLTFLDLLLSPGFWLVAFLTILAFFAMQAALALGKGGIVTAISDGLSISVATLSAVIVFTESVDLIRLVGIILVTGGAIFLHQVSEHELPPQVSLDNQA